MIKAQVQTQSKTSISSRRAVECAIERSKGSKTQTWRELISSHAEDNDDGCTPADEEKPEDEST